MKNLKSVLFTTLLSLTVFTLVFYTSCMEPCYNVTCSGNGVCKDGICNCASGYSGINCENKTDACKDIVCQNGGQCVNGSCNCPTGYSGKFCEVKDDPCKSISCMNGGVCVDGTCQCPVGYEGTRCELESRAKLIKMWIAKDKENGSGDMIPTYNPPITAGSYIQEVRIGKMSDQFFTNDITAIVNNNTITINKQIPDNDGFAIEGTGIYNAANKTITWSYTITNPLGKSETYTGTWQ